MTAVTGEGRIYQILLELLKQWPSGGIPIIYANMPYPPPGQVKADRYIVVSYSPGTPEVIMIKSTDPNRHSGIFGLSVMTMLNTGEMESQDIGGSIAAYFHGKVGLSGTTFVRITARPRVAGGYVDGDRWRTPVTVPYETLSV